MTDRSRIALAALCLALPGALMAQAPARDDAAARCAVWQRETAFADALARHDAAAFAAHLAADAVFIGGNGQASRGREAIVADWAGLIEGKALALRWYPDAVDVSGDGRVALSRGPYWMDNPALPADKRYLSGRFISTWLRGDDGQWRVAFDGGGGNRPQPATQAEIKALAAGRKACPYR